MLRRREGDMLEQLLTRLDLAISRAVVGDIYTDEVNTQHGRTPN
jgi:hypothetical protein